MNAMTFATLTIFIHDKVDNTMIAVNHQKRQQQQQKYPHHHNNNHVMIVNQIHHLVQSLSQKTMSTTTVKNQKVENQNTHQQQKNQTTIMDYKLLEMMYQEAVESGLRIIQLGLELINLIIPSYLTKILIGHSLYMVMSMKSFLMTCQIHLVRQ